VLALTGSATEEFESHIEDADQSFPQVGDPYTHREAISDGIVPDFSWTLAFTQVQDDEHLDDLRTGAEKIPQLVEYDADGLKVPTPTPGSDLSGTDANIQQEVAGEYETGTALAKALRSIGKGPEAPTADLEQVANTLSNRPIHRLNLKTATDRAVELARDAVSNERPVLILTRSYGESEQLSKQLEKVSSEAVIKTIRRDQSADEQDDTIQQFDTADTSKKVLIADGKRIGQGIDIHSVEVGINIAQPGSGANTTLVQRLGRLLRDADGKDTVEFYHLLGVQPAETVLPPDGESFVTNVASFFEQAVLPDTDGVLKPPGTMIDSEAVGQSISVLEQTGVTRINASKQQSQMETAYINAIETTSEDGSPAVTQLEDEVTAEIDMSQRTIDDEDAGTETTMTREVDVDPVLIGLMQEAVESTESTIESQSDVLRTALRPFLKEVATGKVEPEAFASTSTRDIELSADSTLETLLKQAAQRDSTVDSTNELVKQALFKYLDIDPAENTLSIPDYEELRLPIEAVLEDDRYPCETPGDIVEAALRNQFNI
jgi:superfamily II DNA or RNA helicase